MAIRIGVAVLHMHDKCTQSKYIMMKRAIFFIITTILNLYLTNLSLIASFQILNILFGTEPNTRTIVNMFRYQIQTIHSTCCCLTASLFNQEGHGEYFIQDSKLSFLWLWVSRVTKDTTYMEELACAFACFWCACVTYHTTMFGGYRIPWNQHNERCIFAWLDRRISCWVRQSICSYPHWWSKSYHEEAKRSMVKGVLDFFLVRNNPRNKRPP